MKTGTWFGSIGLVLGFAGIENVVIGIRYENSISLSGMLTAQGETGMQKHVPRFTGRTGRHIIQEKKNCLAHP